MIIACITLKNQYFCRNHHFISLQIFLKVIFSVNFYTKNPLFYPEVNRMSVLKQNFQEYG